MLVAQRFLGNDRWLKVYSLSWGRARLIYSDGTGWKDEW